MPIILRIKSVFQRDWVVALIFLGLFLLTNGYIYGWDDQHLEIPMLKGLIDAELYPNDYYVQTLKDNFPSLLYRGLAAIINVQQIPLTYFLLYLLSRFLFFLGLFKLWSHIGQSRQTGFYCTLMAMCIGRVEEFLYRTFSHQEFALGFIMLGIYAFYRERYYLSAAILGFAANFHSLYSLFPMLYMLLAMTVDWKKIGFKNILLTGILFAVMLIPSLAMTIPKYFSMPGSEDPSKFAGWIPLFHIVCPQNFLFYDHSLSEAFQNKEIFLDTTKAYWIIVVFTLLNIIHNPIFRRDRKIHSIMIAGLAMLSVTFYFSYITPSRFIVDLNLIRNIQYMKFFLMGFTTILFVELIRRKEPVLTLLIFGICFALIRFKFYMTTGAGLLMLSCLSLQRGWAGNARQKTAHLSSGILFLGLSIWLISEQISARQYSSSAKFTLFICLGILVTAAVLYCIRKNTTWRLMIRPVFLIIPMIIFIGNYTYYHYRHNKIEKTGGGFWQLQREWIDMQNYVRENTPKKSLLLVPYDMEMGGFRIFSERPIVASYRDCGLIGFDYLAAVEWQKRIKDIESFKVVAREDITPAVMNAVIKYRVNYIVFMRYLNIKDNQVIQKIHQNEVFALFKVLPNP